MAGGPFLVTFMGGSTFTSEIQERGHFHEETKSTGTEEEVCSSHDPFLALE